MKRISLLLAGALACLLIASVGTAAAGGGAADPEPETPKINTTCTTSSKNVIGNKVKITVTGKNVAQSQEKFAKCPTVKKVANKNLSLRMGNCPHRKYLPLLLDMVRNGTIDPAQLLTRQEPLMSAIEAYKEFDKRSPGWVKVELQPQTH